MAKLVLIGFMGAGKTTAAHSLGDGARDVDEVIEARLGRRVQDVFATDGEAAFRALEESRLPGSAAHDEIVYDAQRGFYRRTTRAGGTEGGMSTGDPLVVRVAMKPLSTLRSPLASVDLVTKERVEAAVVRSDVTAVPAAGVIGEAMVAFVLADAMVEKFGGDSLDAMRAAYEAHLRWVRTGPAAEPP